MARYCVSDQLCGSSTEVALGYAGSVRRLELVATDNIAIFDANVNMRVALHSADL